MKKIVLSLADRLSALEAITPLRGSFIEITTAKGLIRDIEITEEDIVISGMREMSGMVGWTSDSPKEIQLSEERISVFKKSIMQLCEKKGLSPLLGGALFPLLVFTSEEKAQLKELVEEMNTKGLISQINIDACENVNLKL